MYKYQMYKFAPLFTILLANPIPDEPINSPSNIEFDGYPAAQSVDSLDSPLLSSIQTAVVPSTEPNLGITRGLGSSPTTMTYGEGWTLVTNFRMTAQATKLAGHLGNLESKQQPAQIVQTTPPISDSPLTPTPQISGYPSNDQARPPPVEIPATMTLSAQASSEVQVTYGPPGTPGSAFPPMTLTQTAAAQSTNTVKNSASPQQYLGTLSVAILCFLY
ncbi:hypothetical protein BC833DRAFT_610615 [Globomyces pollinis-pini]|nr:hypothetical protein BC833DRAFT_610615 [Globomyces pollinis-pini]